jgi:hypothetical protein
MAKAINSICLGSPNGRHTAYDRANPNTRVTKCRYCRASMRIPSENRSWISGAGTKFSPGNQVISATEVTEVSVSLGRCERCNGELVPMLSDAEYVFCPVCEAEWSCDNQDCDESWTIWRHMADSYATCPKCGHVESELISNSLRPYEP